MGLEQMLPVVALVAETHLAPVVRANVGFLACVRHYVGEQLAYAHFCLLAPVDGALEQMALALVHRFSELIGYEVSGLRDEVRERFVVEHVVHEVLARDRLNEPIWLQFELLYEVGMEHVVAFLDGELLGLRLVANWR